MFYPELKGYKVEKELGKLSNSNSNKVYKGIRKDDNLPVAIREYSRNCDSDNYGSFQNQVKILSGLNHPQIPKYIDSVSRKFDFFLIEEYIDGKTISFEEDFQKIKSIANQLLSIVIYLQEQNVPIAHLNINPKNVLIDAFGRIYLVNFCLARNLNHPIISTQLGEIVSNNLNCVAPELLIANKATYSSDLYSIGLTLFAISRYINRVDLSRKFNDNFEIDFEENPIYFDIAKSTQLKIVNWLQKMIAITPAKRFKDAQSALESLQYLEEEDFEEDKDKDKDKKTFGQSFLIEDFEKEFEMPRSLKDLNADSDREGSIKKTEKHRDPTDRGILAVLTGSLILTALAAFLSFFPQIEEKELSFPSALNDRLNRENK